MFIIPHTRSLLGFDVSWFFRLEKLECSFLFWVRGFEHRWLTLFFYGCSTLGSAQGWFVTSCIYMAIIDWVFGLQIGLCALLGAAGAQIIKYTFKRIRPCNSQGPQALAHVPKSSSFPSGHTSTAFAVATFLYLLSSILFFPYLLFALLVSLSRIYLGVHYPSDVICGMVLGTLSGILMNTIL